MWIPKADGGRRPLGVPALEDKIVQGAVAEVIEAWHGERCDEPRPVNVMELYEHLVTEHDYEGSYQSVLHFVRHHYPAPRMRTYRRVETVPGAQS